MSSPKNRKEPRLRVQVPVSLSIGKKTLHASTEDVSYHGLYVAIDDDLPPLRQLVKVEIQLRGGAETFTPHATVVRHGDDYGKKGVGLELFGRTESQAWDAFVREAQQSPVAPSYPSAPPPLPPVQPGVPAGFGPPPMPAPPYLPQAQAAPIIHGLSDKPPPMAPPVAPPYAGANRRRHARFSLPIEIRVRTSRSIHTAVGIDASLGGLSLCAADLALSIGETIVLNLAQPGTPLSFRVEAIVRRTLPAPHPGTFGYGVEFSGLDDARQTVLQDFFDTAVSTLGGSPRPA
jgi:hypothetical protein